MNVCGSGPFSNVPRYLRGRYPRVVGTYTPGRSCRHLMSPEENPIPQPRSLNLSARRPRRGTTRTLDFYPPPIRLLLPPVQLFSPSFPPRDPASLPPHSSNTHSTQASQSTTNDRYAIYRSFYPFYINSPLTRTRRLRLTRNRVSPYRVASCGPLPQLPRATFLPGQPDTPHLIPVVALFHPNIHAPLNSVFSQSSELFNHNHDERTWKRQLNSRVGTRIPRMPSDCALA